MKTINEKNNFAFEFKPVTKLFEEQVQLHPDQCAVISGGEELTYVQLNKRANRIANATHNPINAAGHITSIVAFS